LLSELTAVADVHDEVKKADLLCQKVIPAMERLREMADRVEGVISDPLWPLPKYREMLFLR